jgi:predicted acyltransferase
MPSFLFIVGLSMVLANQNENKTGFRGSLFWKIAFRCARLFVLGLLIQGTTFGTGYDFSTLRIPGILQRIAFCQFIVAIMELALPTRETGFEDLSYFRVYKRYVWHWVLAGLIFFIFAIITYTTPVPGCSMGQTTPECNSAGYWDTQILGIEHMYQVPTYRRLPECSSCSPRRCPLVPPAEPASWCNKPFDPEGGIASIGAILSVFFGAFVAHQFIDTQERPSERVRQLAPLGSALALVGLVMHFAGIPFNKNLYSLSYIFFTAGVAIGVLLLLCVLIDMSGIERPFVPLIWLGLNAIFVFVGNTTLDAILGWFYFRTPDSNLVTLVRDKVLVDSLGFDGGMMAFTWLKMVFWIAVAGLMKRYKIFVKI